VILDTFPYQGTTTTCDAFAAGRPVVSLRGSTPASRVSSSLLAAVGLAGFENKQPWQLSGGMQQRVSLCRALIHEPQLLMLDEPFGALDAFTREELWGVLHDLWWTNRFTVILVTHDLREAVYLADKVFVMSNRPGRLIASKAVPRNGRRNISDTSRVEFNETVQELREHIWRLRGQ
jgi:NitT/TauT family transport system ATP-binding protein